jgi:hypothetical protein
VEDGLSRVAGTNEDGYVLEYLVIYGWYLAISIRIVYFIGTDSIVG